MSVYGLPQLVDSVATVRRNTVLVAEDIPAEHYGYRVAPDTRSVAETLVHVTLAWTSFERWHTGSQRISTLEGIDFREQLKASRAEETRPRSKEEILDLLRTNGAHVHGWLTALPESTLAEPVRQRDGSSRLRLELLLGAKEHEMHHRAQLMTMQRMIGLVPHLTRQMQERMAAMMAAQPQAAAR